MTIFLCAKCSIELTPDLTAIAVLPALPPDFGRVKTHDIAQSTVPRGHYFIEPEPREAPVAQRQGREVFAGPPNQILINPDDAPLVQNLPGQASRTFCCGPWAGAGPNAACPCGNVLATLAADCDGPYEMFLDPVRVFLLG